MEIKRVLIVDKEAPHLLLVSLNQISKVGCFCLLSSIGKTVFMLVD